MVCADLGALCNSHLHRQDGHGAEGETEAQSRHLAGADGWHPFGDPQSPILGCDCPVSIDINLPVSSGSGVGAEGPFYHHLQSHTCTDTRLAWHRC